MEFIAQFTAARRVSTPLINIRTFDAKSATAAILDSLGVEKDETPVLIWDALHGLALVTNTQASKDTLDKVLGDNGQQMSIPLPETLRMLENDEVRDIIVFILNAHLHWKNDPIVIQGIWNLRDSYKSNGNMAVLVTTPGAQLPEELVNDILVLDEALPTVDELGTQIGSVYKYAKVAAPDDLTVKQATEALIGLPAFAAEQATAMCLNIVTNGKERTGDLDLKELWDRKRQIINQTPGLTFHAGNETLDDIGGVQSAKDFLAAIMTGNDAPNIILFSDEIEKAYAGHGTDMSGTKTELTGSMLSWMQDKGIDGVILLGIPGVSKSALSKGLAGTYKKPLIHFDIAAMQSSLVGSSGAQLRAAQATVDAIRGGGKALMVATCNGISSLPPELRRRFNLATFFFDAPSREEKDIIWKIHRKKYNISVSDTNPKDEGWTGAEIEQCCLKAYRLKWALEKSAQYIVPITISAKDAIAKTRQEASGKYLSASKPGIYTHLESFEAKPGLSAPVFNNESNGRRMRE